MMLTEEQKEIMLMKAALKNPSNFYWSSPKSGWREEGEGEESKLFVIDFNINIMKFKCPAFQFILNSIIRDIEDMIWKKVLKERLNDNRVQSNL